MQPDADSPRIEFVPRAIRGSHVMIEPTEIVQRVTRAMHCSKCGVEAAAACDCGAPYIPAGVAAAKAVAAHPEKSDRPSPPRSASITKLWEPHVRQVGSMPPERVTGKDGKSYPQPEKKPKPVNGLNAVGKPYSPQFDPNYKMRKQVPVKVPDRGRGDVAEDMLAVLSGLNKERRADFFRALWDKFRDELIEAQTASGEKAVPPKPDGFYPKDNAPPPEVGAEIMKAKLAALDDGIPDLLRRT